MATGDSRDWDIDERFAGLDAMATEARLIADRTLASTTGDEEADRQRDTMNCRESLIAVATEALRLADDLGTRKITIADRPAAR
jgi:hypothetical protein